MLVLHYDGEALHTVPALTVRIRVK